MRPVFAAFDSSHIFIYILFYRIAALLVRTVHAPLANSCETSAARGLLPSRGGSTHHLPALLTVPLRAATVRNEQQRCAPTWSTCPATGSERLPPLRFPTASSSAPCVNRYLGTLVGIGTAVRASCQCTCRPHSPSLQIAPRRALLPGRRNDPNAISPSHTTVSFFFVNASSPFFNALLPVCILSGMSSES